MTTTETATLAELEDLDRSRGVADFRPSIQRAARVVLAVVTEERPLSTVWRGGWETTERVLAGEVYAVYTLAQGWTATSAPKAARALRSGTSLAHVARVIA